MKTNRIRFWRAALAGIGFGLWLCAVCIASEPAPREWTDLSGAKVTLPSTIRRIVLIRGRDMYELGALLGDDLPQRLVAFGPDFKSADRDGYEAFIARYPSLAKLPETGDVFKDAVSAEQILDLQPDLVIMDVFMLERGYKCVGQLRAAGLPLLFLDGSGDPLASPQRSLRLLGAVLGGDAARRAEEIAALADAKTAEVLSRIKELKGPMPSVYLETGGHISRFGVTYGGYGNPRHYSGWGEILHQLRVRNIADGIIGNMSQIHPEFVLQANPEIIVITGQSWESPGLLHLGYGATESPGLALLANLRNRPGWDGLRAIQDGRVYGVYHNFSMHFFGFVCIEALAKDFYPDAFADLHPEKDLAEVHARFLPFPLRGVWMLPVEP